MRAHLHVAVHPFASRDALADLEQHVLTQLDPPLNLDGRPTSPARVRLTALRRRRTSVKKEGRQTGLALPLACRRQASRRNAEPTQRLPGRWRRYLGAIPIVRREQIGLDSDRRNVAIGVMGYGRA